MSLTLAFAPRESNTRTSPSPSTGELVDGVEHGLHLVAAVVGIVIVVGPVGAVAHLNREGPAHVTATIGAGTGVRRSGRPSAAQRSAQQIESCRSLPR